jgi:iron-sulfur cluster assembly protein
VLAITEDAASAINTIVANADLPDGSGVRICRMPAESPSGDSDEPQMELRLSVVAGPEEGDQAVEGEPVFVEPAAAEVLEDKVLDAEVDGERVRFVVGRQA